MPAEVAIAVVSWNTRDLLAACLDSLRADADAGRAEVWVCDNASADGSADLVRDAYGWVQLVASQENLGFGPAVNEVARRTSTPWIAPANADVALEPGALGALLAAAKGDARAGAVAPRLILPGGATQHSVHPFPTLPNALAFNLGLARVVPGLGPRLGLEGHWDPDRARAVDWAHGALLLVRRTAWDQVGGFDPDQWLYAEDLDLCWRLARAGWSTRYEPAARVRHAVSAATAQAFGDERGATAQRSAYVWMRRRRGDARTTAYAAISLGGAGVRAAALAAASRVAPARYSYRRDRARTYVRMHREGLRAAR